MHFGTDGHWGKWALGENGHQEKRAPEQMGFGQFGQMSGLGKWVCGDYGSLVVAGRCTICFPDEI